MAVLHARGELRVGEPFQGRSIINSRFDCMIDEELEVGGKPAIAGRAWITGTHQHMLTRTTHGRRDTASVTPGRTPIIPRDHKILSDENKPVFTVPRSPDQPVLARCPLFPQCCCKTHGTADLRRIWPAAPNS